MNTGIVKSKASGLALMGKVLVGMVVLGAGIVPQGAKAAATDPQFFQYFQTVCNVMVVPPNWDAANLALVCFSTDILSGGASAGSYFSANLGAVNAGSGAASRKKNGIRVQLDEQEEKKGKGASADGSGWGLLVTPQYGKSDRPETIKENGYQSTLTGLVVGLDYRFSDSFVLGLAVGQTKDKATFLNNVGFQNSSSNIATMYGTWLISENSAVDGYLGYGKLKLENQRYFVASPTISGTMSGNTTGQQTMAGLSVSHQSAVGRFSLAPSFNLDYIKTTIKSYNESGIGNNPYFTFLALHYGDRSVTSLTSSLGGRLSTSYGYDWGALIPSMRLAAVHEFQNKSRQLSNELVLTPGSGFSVETDSPDCNYLNIGLGVTAAMNGGAQLFLDYEKRTQDKLLRSWAVSLGGLFEF